MDKGTEEQLKEMLKDLEENNSILSNGNGLWVLMLLALMFNQPIKQEPSITNIYIGGE